MFQKNSTISTDFIGSLKSNRMLRGGSRQVEDYYDSFIQDNKPG
ncbi:MAG: hypothetical protein ACP5FZ_10865 [Fidelibacterota bacterium]